jgi:hypothetical protein
VSQKLNLNVDQRPHNKAIDATCTDVPSVSTALDVREQPPAVHQADLSPGERLLATMWRSPDCFHLIGVLNRKTNKFQNLPVDGAADAVAQALKLSRDGAEVYFACAEYLTPHSREAANAAGACAFWMDIDCGEDKAASGKGYSTVQGAEEALTQY